MFKTLCIDWNDSDPLNGHRALLVMEEVLSKYRTVYIAETRCMMFPTQPNMHRLFVEFCHE